MNILHRTHFNAPPLFFAAWTGAGNVGVLAVDYFRRKLDAHLFAQIDMSQFITPEAIVVNAGVASFPETPQSVFYHHHNPDLVIFESNAHAGGTSDVEVMRAILDLAHEVNAPRIYTAAALPQSISHAESPGVLYACNNPKLIGELDGKGLKAMPNGIISGLNGLLLGFAAARNVDAICLLAAMPAYAAGLTYPRAAAAIVEKFSNLVGVSIDMSELGQETEAVDPMFAEIENKIKEFFSSESIDEQSPAAEVEQENVPKYVMDRIEKLFSDAARDRTRASELKGELDRWGLYKFYEDRFLDLFDEGDRE